MTTKTTKTTTKLQGEGNTNPPPQKRIQSRKWCFTLNNWTNDEYENIMNYITTKGLTYVIGKEVGKNGTPHLQGYIECKSPITFDSLKNLMSDRAHLEKAKARAEDNLNYCSKQGDFVTNIEGVCSSPQERIKQKLLAKYEQVIWKPWQQQVLDIINSPSDDRTINWVYDPKGNNGKSFLVKYISLTKDCVIADGKKENVFNQLLQETETKDVQIILLDIPRHNQEYLNYGMLEQLKDGLIYSGKYEGGRIYLDCPHVVVFSNSEPDYEKFTRDRWNIISIT